ncbi:NADH-quinone oxidoreductase subunit NuoN [Neisseria sp. Ec49-e6-T10]|uniref:NADH-quinone oxidoreductase subunit NuoN n=1 Tax=Neisseria sp. Ec49-e6-T10 TaxID=3140744 RepID=UPI003EB89B90
MNWASLNLIPAMPEIVLLVALCIVLLVDLFISDKNRGITVFLSLLSLIIVAVVQFYTLPVEPTLAFSDMFVADGLSQMVKFVMYIVVFFGFVYSRNYLKDRDIYKGEFYSLALFALLGMNVMVSATHFLTLYIGLELLSLALYALIAMQRDVPKASEAALKYFVLGALASGLLLYGISMVYGATGSLYLEEVLFSLSEQPNSMLMRFGLVFIVAGLAFKLGAVPFHMWVPDVYQGAPTPVAMFIGAAPKLAAFVFMFRILVAGLVLLIKDWSAMLMLLAILSLIIGNLTAIAQTNIKRMLAYSTISHMGFILFGLAGGAEGLTAALFYTVSYVFMSMVAFGVLIALSNKDFECEQISDLKGLNQKSPWLAFLMLMAMFSMAGIPPLLGFFAKFTIIELLIQLNYPWLAVFAVVMSLIGAFYYLRVVKVMYFDQQEHDEKASFSWDAKVLLSINALILLVFGVYSNSLIAWCTAAFQNVLGG